jgi:hypothetical protein
MAVLGFILLDGQAKPEADPEDLPGHVSLPLGHLTYFLIFDNDYYGDDRHHQR